MFNYFPTKEDLFCCRLEAFEVDLLAAVRERPPGRSILAAFAAFLLDEGGVLAMGAPGDDREATRQIQSITRMITGSPALLARERQVFDHYARSVAELIGDESGAEPVTCRVVANVPLGLHRGSAAQSAR